MEEIQQQENTDRELASSNRFVVLFLFVVGAILAFLAWFHFRPKKKALKRQAAEMYGITTKVMVNWMTLLFPPDLKERYVDSKSKKVILEDLHRHLGKPEERPTTTRGKAICKKDDFIWACGISPSALKRKIKAIENPHVAIGMSQEAFAKLRVMPPRHAGLILKHLQSQGFPLR